MVNTVIKPSSSNTFEQYQELSDTHLVSQLESQLPEMQELARTASSIEKQSKHERNLQARIALSKAAHALWDIVTDHYVRLYDARGAR